jgi:SAM-dependent methyltransferase
MLNQAEDLRARKEIELWLDGIAYEVAFWNGRLSNRKYRFNLMEEQKSDEASGIQTQEIFAEYLREMEQSRAEQSYLYLDVGCGLSYRREDCLREYNLETHYVDPLAIFYNEVLDKYGLDLPRIEFGMIEYLSSFFPVETADCIAIRNALDHCFNPVKGMEECLKVLRKGGILYLEHTRNEAENESYRGFHQFNIDLREGEAYIWNSETEVCLNDTFEKRATVKSVEKDGKIISLISKKEDAGDAGARENNQDVELLCTQLLYVIKKFSNKGYLLRRCADMAFMEFGQKIVQQLDRKWKRKIKGILKSTDKAPFEVRSR